ncbi:EamA family transporter [Candidatus Woesearchaeota archaeon]|nr:EamA family transporter [Candidatus Woesearchaeota archaeon]
MARKKQKQNKPRMMGPVLMVLCTLFLACSQFLMKIASKTMALSFEGIFLNWAFLAGLVMAGFGAVIMTLAFKHGDLSSLFPLISLSFIWTLLIAALVFGESIHLFAYIGVALIIVGVVVLGGEA